MPLKPTPLMLLTLPKLMKHPKTPLNKGLTVTTVSMDFRSEKKEGYTLIKVLRGKLDEGLTPSLKMELVRIQAGGEKNMVFDLSACTGCNSSGLSSLLIANRLCKIAGGRLGLTGLSEGWVQLLREAQLDQLCLVADSTSRAAQLFYPSSPAASAPEGSQNP
jgi:anti-anti-sigma regulatory factor